MKTLTKIFQSGILIILLAFATLTNAQSHDHSNHAKHNMVLFGDTQLYLSHLVYKVPHNYQVILAVTLSPEGRALYENVKAQNPETQTIFQLDSIDISQIQIQKMNLTGTLSKISADGSKEVLANSLPVLDYKVIYFDELPLSLAKE